MNTRGTLFSLSAALTVALWAALALPASLSAQTDTDQPAPVQHGPNFVDENGDGYNDNAPDHDGDGIPNGKDPDWIRPADGTGKQNGKAWRGVGSQGKGKGLQNGMANGIRQRLRDGRGLNCSGTGECTGTGSQGSASRGRGRGGK